MYKFESKYIIIMNSNIKQFNTFKTNIEQLNLSPIKLILKGRTVSK